MPLIDNGGGGLQFIVCRCGAEHRDYAGHYAHLGKCSINRCAQCLTMLSGPDGDDPETHQCPETKLIS